LCCSTAFEKENFKVSTTRQKCPFRADHFIIISSKDDVNSIEKYIKQNAKERGIKYNYMIV
jgi:hypothetical protein